MTSFVGREKEIVDLARLVGDARLVTLTGPGGCGKSRLAMAVGDRLRTAFPDGLWWVGLAALSDPASVATAVAEAVRSAERLEVSATDSVIARLSTTQALLICDNCEHLVAPVAELVERLLRECPGVRVLATSQEALGVPGETHVTVPPLSLPRSGRWSSAEDLGGFEAVRLFRDRARTASPGFEVNESNAGAVAQICRRLDGVPLAIELAAARVRVLSPAQIAERLDDCMEMLVGGDRMALPRHRALQSTMDWSYRLLPAGERRLLGRLSVFRGSFTIEAVEAIAAGVEGGPAPKPLKLLSGLVNRSLVVVEQGDEVRYRLLEPIRQYAEGKLARGGDAQLVRAVRERHARFFVELAERGENRLSTTGQSRWLDLLDSERDNFRTALRWCLEEWPEGALRLATALWWFCYLRGHYSQGREWLDDALRTAGPGLPAALTAKALVASGMLAHLECDYDAAAKLLREAHDAYTDLADRRGIALALQALGSVARERGDYAGAWDLHQESLGLWGAMGDHQGLARSLNHLGFTAWLEQDYETAARLCTRARSLFHRVGDVEGTAWSLINLGSVALYRSDHASAGAMLQESLTRSREAGYREGVAWSLNQLGVLALRGGDPTRAEDLLRESLGEHRALGDRWRTAGVLDGLAAAAVAQGDPERAIRLLGSATGLREAIGTPVPAAERADRRQAIAAARTAVPEAFDELWAAAQLAPVDQVIGEATAVTRRAAPTTMAIAEPVEVLEPVAVIEPLTVVEPVEVLAAPLRVLGFASARVFRDQALLQPADWTYAKPRELLFFLLSETDRTKDQIGSALWPWSSQTQLRNSFHTTLHHLRRALGSPDWITYRRGRYAFNRSLDYTFDLEAFQAGLAQAQAVPAEAVSCLTAAAGLYEGDFLADLPGEQWIDDRRSALRRSYEQALLRLGGLHAAAGRYSEAAEVYQRAVAHDPLLESAHRELIRCCARLGEKGRALRHYQSLVDLLRDELGVSPSPQTDALYAALRSGQAV